MLFRLGALQASSWWLAVWVDNEAAEAQSFYLSVYGAIQGVWFVCAVAAFFVALQGMKSLSTRSHSEALWALFRSPMSYFDSTQSGRIINRFSSDLSKIDSSLTDAIRRFCGSVLDVLFGVAIVFSTAYYIVCVLVPACFFFYRLQQTFRSSARELQRLCSTSRSPVFDSFTEALNGVETVRMFGPESKARFEAKNRKGLLGNLSAYYNSFSATVWLGMRLNLVSLVVFSAIVFMGVLQHQFHWNLSLLSAGGKISAGIIGLGLTKALSVTDLLVDFVNNMTTAETSLVALERVMALQRLEAEAPLIAEACPIQRALDQGQKWPQDGLVKFQSALGAPHHLHINPNNPRALLALLMF